LDSQKHVIKFTSKKCQLFYFADFSGFYSYRLYTMQQQNVIKKHFIIFLVCYAIW